jgi:hypothetical protein
MRPVAFMIALAIFVFSASVVGAAPRKFSLDIDPIELQEELGTRTERTPITQPIHPYGTVQLEVYCLPGGFLEAKVSGGTTGMSVASYEGEAVVYRYKKTITTLVATGLDGQVYNVEEMRSADTTFNSDGSEIRREYFRQTLRSVGNNRLSLMYSDYSEGIFLPTHAVSGQMVRQNSCTFNPTPVGERQD